MRFLFTLPAYDLPLPIFLRRLGINFPFWEILNGMIKTNRNLVDAKKYISTLKDKELDVQVNLGRNKCAYYRGKLTAVYPALFTVMPNGEFLGKTSFSYSELLSGGVKVRKSKAEAK